MGPNLFIPLRNYFPRHEDDFIANNEIIIQNDNLRNVDNIIDDNTYNDDITYNSDDSRENGNEYYGSSYMFFTPTLEDLKNILYVALNPFFEEFEIEMVSCPCLTKAPYNLAAAGLSGNTGILHIGSFVNFYPKPRTNFAYNIQYMLSRCNDDVFVIGSGFTTQPFQPYNGQLTMNAVVLANSTNVINNSCVAFKNANQLRLKIINDHNELECSIFGHFFFNEGKRGTVIKIRAKGRRSKYNLITLIQIVLKKRCHDKPLIGLGIVLVLNGGRTDQFIISDDFVRYNYETYDDYFDQLRVYTQNCKSLIALGALTSKTLMVLKRSNGSLFLRDSCSMFNTFSNDELAGEFFNDVTPEETEYIVYLNIAQERSFAM